MVTRANARTNVGGHIATYASAASLYEVGFNHFFRGKDHGESGDQVFFQGHAARASTRAPSWKAASPRPSSTPSGRSCPTGFKGLPSYPHPRLMPDFWEFPTVSMGLGPIGAIYQARFNRYLQDRQDQGHLPQPRVGLPRRRRDGRARVARRASASPPARSSTT